MLYTVPTKRTVDLFDELHGRRAERLASPDADGVPVCHAPADPVRAATEHYASIISGMRFRSNAKLRQPPKLPINLRCAKGVVCIETTEVYASFALAAKAAGRAHSAISTAIATGTKCAGYHWRRATDAESRAAAEKIIDELEVLPTTRPSPVVCISTGTLYASNNQAAFATGISSASVRNSIRNGKPIRGGFAFRHATPEEVAAGRSLTSTSAPARKTEAA